MKKLLPLCGIAAAVVYVFAVILGGILRPEYSHTLQAISSLIATGAPNKALLDPLFGLYNLLVVAFGIGLVQIILNAIPNRRRTLGLVGAGFLISEGLFGFATLFFPQPTDGSPIVATGMMHIILASLSSVTTMLTILLMGFWLHTAEGLRRFGTWSFLSVLVIFVSGGLAAVSIATNSPIGGLLERITIGGFLQWLAVVAFKFYGNETTEFKPSMKMSSQA